MNLIIAWSFCFNTIAVTIAKKHPTKFQELVAYHSTILMVALQFRCKGWLSYNKMFHELVEKEKPYSS